MAPRNPRQYAIADGHEVDDLNAVEGVTIAAAADIPARLFGGNAQDVEINGLDYTLHLNIKKLLPVTPPGGSVGQWVAVWDAAQDTYKRVQFNETGALLKTGGTMTGELILFPPAESTEHALFSFHPGITAGVTTTGAYLNYNLIANGADQANCTLPASYTNLLFVDMVTGGSNSVGSKAAIFGRITVTAAPNPAVPQGDHIGVVMGALAAVNMGGTSTASPATAKGTLFASAPSALLRSGATNWFVISGGEVNIGIDTGASCYSRFGLSYVGIGEKPADSIYDCAIELSSSTVPWKYGILLSNLHGGPPMPAAGTFIGDDGTAATIAHFIHVPSYTINGYIFNFTNLKIAGNGDFEKTGKAHFNGSSAGFVEPCAMSLKYAGGPTEAGFSIRPVADTSIPIAFYNSSGSVVGSVSTSTTATGYNTTSDGRLKEDLQAFNSGVIIDAISAYDFRWKDSDERAYGVIAQDAAKVLPQACYHDQQTDRWGTDYSKFVPILLAEIKALRKRVAEIEGSAL